MVFNKVRMGTFLGGFSLILLYFITRLTNLMSLPIFTDEAIYVRWSQIARQDAAWRFISLTDGKQPSFVWVAMNIMRVVSDPLFAARLVSVFAGLGALIGIIFLTLEVFKKKQGGGTLNQMFGQFSESLRIGFIAGILFILFPFSLVLDRMALYDSLLFCTMVWSLYFEILLVRYLRLDIALLLGVVIGSSLLTKTSGFFSIYLLPFSLLLFDFKQKNVKLKLVLLLGLSAISVGVAYSLYIILRLSPFFYIIDEKNALFVYSFSDWIRHPFEFVHGNFSALIPWLLTYVTAPVLGLVVCAFFIKGHMKEKVLLILWFLLPFIALGFFGKTLYPRFIYFMTMPLLVLTAFTLNNLVSKVRVTAYKAGIFLLFLSLFLYADYFIIFNISYAPIPKADLGQYINSWPAGGGVKEMVAFFNKQAKGGKIYVATQGTFGSLPTNSMQIYLEKNKNIETRGIYPPPSQVPSDLLKKAKTMPVYYVFNDFEEAPLNWPVTLIAKYQKGIGDRHLSIYRVNP